MIAGRSVRLRRWLAVAFLAAFSAAMGVAVFVWSVPVPETLLHP